MSMVPVSRSPYMQGSRGTYSRPRARQLFSDVVHDVAGYGPYSRAAESAARLIGRNMKTLIKRRQMRKRRRLGTGSARISEPPQKASTTVFRHFQYGSTSASENMTRKTLHARIIKPCLPPGNNDDLTAAPAMSYYLSGLRLCYTINAFPLPGGVFAHCHMALVQPKEFNIQTEDIPAISKDFFVNSTDSTERYADFSSFADSPTWGRIQDCAPINTRKFNVMFHKKILLSPNGISASGAPQIIHHDEYIPIKKRFEYEKIDSTDVVKPLFLLFWWESITPNNTNLSGLQINCNTRAFVRKTP